MGVILVSYRIVVLVSAFIELKAVHSFLHTNFPLEMLERHPVPVAVLDGVLFL